MLRETQALIAANGNIELAAEVLDIDSNDLLSRVASDDAEGIKTALKIANAVHTLDALTEVKAALLSRLDELSPALLAKLFVSLVEKSHEISLESLPTTNIFDNRQVNFGETVRETLADKISGLMQNNNRHEVIDVVDGR